MFPKNSLPSSSVKWHIEFNSMLNHSFEIKWFAASKISLDNHRGQKLRPCCVTCLFAVRSHCGFSGLQVPASVEVQKKKPLYLTLKNPTISFSSLFSQIFFLTYEKILAHSMIHAPPTVLNSMISNCVPWQIVSSNFSHFLYICSYLQNLSKFQYRNTESKCIKMLKLLWENAFWSFLSSSPPKSPQGW